MLRQMGKSRSIVLHTAADGRLPADVDGTRHARYWTGAFNGVVLRMALLALVLGAVGDMELTLNGRTVVAEPADGQSLLDLLRDDLGLRSLKDGCAPEGSCGACTVIVDGRAVVSCAQKATRAADKHVVTQEGLSQESRRLWAGASPPQAHISAASARRGSC